MSVSVCAPRFIEARCGWVVDRLRAVNGGSSAAFARSATESGSSLRDLLEILDVGDQARPFAPWIEAASAALAARKL